MEAAHVVEGEKTYELTVAMKEQFDRVFPEARGQYPKIVMTTIPLDTEENYILQGVSGVLVKYDVRFENNPCWQVKDLKYSVSGDIKEKDKTLQMELCSVYTGKYNFLYEWDELKERYDIEDLEALARAFENCDVCPQSEEQLGEVWSPFRTSIGLCECWRSYLEYKQLQRQSMYVKIAECGCADICSLNSDFRDSLIQCAYQGVYAGGAPGEYYMEDAHRVMFFWKMNGSR